MHWSRSMQLLYVEPGRQKHLCTGRESYHRISLPNNSVLCTIGGDHRSRSRYDNVWSVLRPGQIGPLHSPLNVCKVCACIVMCCSCYYSNSTCKVKVKGLVVITPLRCSGAHAFSRDLIALPAHPTYIR